MKRALAVLVSVLLLAAGVIVADRLRDRPGDAPALTATMAILRELDDYDPRGVYLEFAENPDVSARWKVAFDADGVLRVPRAGRPEYHPAKIAMYGLQQYSYWVRRGDAAARDRAIAQADWLVANQEPGTGLWRYPFPFKVGGFDETLPAGWTSAMAQGQVISLLTRVHALRPDDPRYLAAADRALDPLERPVEEGGLVAMYRGSRPFYEEYPTRIPSFTLNGFQFTLIGLADLAATGDRRARRLFDAGFDTMVAALPDFDRGTISAYHLGHLTKPPRPVHTSVGYHRTHVYLLHKLNAIRPDATAIGYARRWAGYPAMDG